MVGWVCKPVLVLSLRLKLNNIKSTTFPNFLQLWNILLVPQVSLTRVYYRNSLVLKGYDFWSPLSLNTRPSKNENNVKTKTKTRIFESPYRDWDLSSLRLGSPPPLMIIPPDDHTPLMIIPSPLGLKKVSNPIFLPKFGLNKKISQTQNCFWTKMFVDPKYFWALNIFGPKLVLDPN